VIYSPCLISTLRSAATLHGSERQKKPATRPLNTLSPTPLACIVSREPRNIPRRVSRWVARAAKGLVGRGWGPAQLRRSRPQPRAGHYVSAPRFGTGPRKNLAWRGPENCRAAKRLERVGPVFSARGPEKARKNNHAPRIGDRRTAGPAFRCRVRKWMRPGPHRDEGDLPRPGPRMSGCAPGPDARVEGADRRDSGAQWE